MDLSQLLGGAQPPAPPKPDHMLQIPYDAWDEMVPIFARYMRADRHSAAETTWHIALSRMLLDEMKRQKVRLDPDLVTWSPGCSYQPMTKPPAFALIRCKEDPVALFSWESDEGEQLRKKLVEGDGLGPEMLDWILWAEIGRLRPDIAQSEDGFSMRRTLTGFMVYRARSDV